MSRVFISYRRDDSADVTGRIYDRLVLRFGADSVFKDVDDIPHGADFRKVLGDAVGRCQVLLAVIGRHWLSIAGRSGVRRLDDPRDFVRLEIEAALRRDIPVIPVLVGDAEMPSDEQLPQPLQELAFRHAIPVRRDPDFHRDVERLLKCLDGWLQNRRKEIVNALGMKLVLVPRGTFWMGDRGSQRQVEVPRDFYIGAFPVTQEQWPTVMGSNPSHFSSGGGGSNKVKGISDADLNQFPVEQVSWERAQEFLKRLNAREQAGGFLYRLPTEAEWEYSCRGAASSQTDCAFDFYLAQPTNDLSSDLANFNGNHPAGNAPKGKSLERTSKVGSYHPNRLGIYDMHGNVWEWCEDPFEAGDSARVIRGGSWGNNGVYCRASYRYWGEPSGRNDAVGLRLVAVPSGE
jgi:formylglycine-generating enzyme required for sulfatase activity